jgi:hypothetical protein
MVQEFKGKDPGKRLVVNTILAGACKRIFFLFFDPCMLLPMEYHRPSMIRRMKVRLPAWQAV